MKINKTEIITPNYSSSFEILEYLSNLVQRIKDVYRKTDVKNVNNETKKFCKRFRFILKKLKIKDSNSLPNLNTIPLKTSSNPLRSIEDLDQLIQKTRKECQIGSERKKTDSIVRFHDASESIINQIRLNNCKTTPRCFRKSPPKTASELNKVILKRIKKYCNKVLDQTITRNQLAAIKSNLKNSILEDLQNAAPKERDKVDLQPLKLFNLFYNKILQIKNETKTKNYREYNFDTDPSLELIRKLIRKKETSIQPRPNFSLSSDIHAVQVALASLSNIQKKPQFILKEKKIAKYSNQTDFLKKTNPGILRTFQKKDAQNLNSSLEKRIKFYQKRILNENLTSKILYEIKNNLKTTTLTDFSKADLKEKEKVDVNLIISFKNLYNEITELQLLEFPNNSNLMDFDSDQKLQFLKDILNRNQGNDQSVVDLGGEQPSRETSPSASKPKLVITHKQVFVSNSPNFLAERTIQKPPDLPSPPPLKKQKNKSDENAVRPLLQQHTSSQSKPPKRTREISPQSQIQEAIAISPPDSKRQKNRAGENVVQPLLQKHTSSQLKPPKRTREISPQSQIQETIAISPPDSKRQKNRAGENVVQPLLQKHTSSQLKPPKRTREISPQSQIQETTAISSTDSKNGENRSMADDVSISCMAFKTIPPERLKRTRKSPLRFQKNEENSTVSSPLKKQKVLSNKERESEVQQRIAAIRIPFHLPPLKQVIQSIQKGRRKFAQTTIQDKLIQAVWKEWKNPPKRDKLYHTLKAKFDAYKDSPDYENESRISIFNSLDPELNLLAVALKMIQPGEIVGEYAGTVERNSEDQNNRYVFNFQPSNKYEQDFLKRKKITDLSISAIEFCNHTAFVSHNSGKDANIEVHCFLDQEGPHIIYQAKRVIAKGEPLTIDYGEGYWKAIKLKPVKITGKATFI